MKYIETCSRDEIESYIGIQSKSKFFTKALDKYERNRNCAIWNFSAFFLGPFYLMYRKCYIPAIIVAAFYYVIAFQNILILIPSMLIVMTLLGLFGTTIYLQHAEKDINMLQEYNYMKSEEELKQIISKKGGTSFLAGTLLYFGLIIPIWVIIFTS